MVLLSSSLCYVLSTKRKLRFSGDNDITQKSFNRNVHVKSVEICTDSAIGMSANMNSLLSSISLFFELF